MNRFRPRQLLSYTPRNINTSPKSNWRDNANFGIAVIALIVTIFFSIKSCELTMKYGDSRDLIDTLHRQSVRQDSLIGQNNEMISRLISIDSLQGQSLKELKGQTKFNVNNSAPLIDIFHLSLSSDTSLKTKYKIAVGFKNSGGRTANDFYTKLIVVLRNSHDSLYMPIELKDSIQGISGSIAGNGGIRVWFKEIFASEEELVLLKKCFFVFRYHYTDELLGKKNIQEIYQVGPSYNSDVIELEAISIAKRNKIKQLLKKAHLEKIEF